MYIGASGYVKADDICKRPNCLFTPGRGSRIVSDVNKLLA